MGDRAFPVTAARAWNALPSSVRSAPSLLQFRCDLKIRAYFCVYYYTKCVLLKADRATLKTKMCNIKLATQTIAYIIWSKTVADALKINVLNTKTSSASGGFGYRVSLRQTVHAHCASVHQAAKFVVALLRVARVTAGLAESNGSLLPGLRLPSPAGL